MFRKFRSIPGRVVPRYGTDTFIGCVRTREVDASGRVSHGFEWHDRVVLIPDVEVRRYNRSYLSALRNKDLIEVTDELETDESAATQDDNDSALDGDGEVGPLDPETEPQHKQRGRRRRRSS